MRPLSFFIVKKKEGGVLGRAHQRPLQEEGDGGLARKENGSCHMSPLDECPAIGGRETRTRAREDTGIRPPFEEDGGVLLTVAMRLSTWAIGGREH